MFVTLPLPNRREPDGLYRVCLVCLGNICRSPMAEVVLRASLESAGLSDSVVVDSAGTGDWHLGERMNSGARAALARRGYDGSSHRARQFEASWFSDHDLVLAMDLRNLANLRHMGGPDEAGRVVLFGEFGGLPTSAAAGGGEIPDPYGGSSEDFDHVLDLLESAAPVIAERLGQLPDEGPLDRVPPGNQRGSRPV